MKPDFNIIAESNSITEALRESLISLHIIDGSGTISDEAEICADYNPSVSKLKGKLQILLGFKETGLLPMGIYVANEITVQSPPKTLRIKCNAASFRGSLKEKTSKEWNNINLGSLIKDIVQKHGYEGKVAEKFENIFIPHIAKETKVA